MELSPFVLKAGKELIITFGQFKPSKAALKVKMVKRGEIYRYCSSLIGLFNLPDDTKHIVAEMHFFFCATCVGHACFLPPRLA